MPLQPDTRHTAYIAEAHRAAELVLETVWEEGKKKGIIKQGIGKLGNKMKKTIVVYREYKASNY